MKARGGKQGISSAVEPEVRKIQRNPGISLLRAQIDPSESEGLTSLISTTLFLFFTICPSPSSAAPNAGGTSG